LHRGFKGEGKGETRCAMLKR